jgi:hypothetical protein
MPMIVLTGSSSFILRLSLSTNQLKSLPHFRVRLAGRVVASAGAIVLQMLLGVISLSATVLSPADLGLNALLMSMSALVGVASDGGVGIVFPAH